MCPTSEYEAVLFVPHTEGMSVSVVFHAHDIKAAHARLLHEAGDCTVLWLRRRVRVPAPNHRALSYSPVTPPVVVRNTGAA